MKIAFYKGRSRIFNRFVSWWTQGPYSHCEAIFNGTKSLDTPTLCWSSSFMDGGVRSKLIYLDPEKWDVIDVPAMDILRALDWFNQHRGDKYDLLGLLSTSLPVPHNRGKWICNEAVGESGEVIESWRTNPNSFARLVERLPGSRWVQGSMNTSINNKVQS